MNNYHEFTQSQIKTLLCLYANAIFTSEGGLVYGYTVRLYGKKLKNINYDAFPLKLIHAPSVKNILHLLLD